MPKPQSLADLLGVDDPRSRDPKDPAPRPEEQRVEGILNLEDPTAFCKAIVQSREWRQYILNGTILGDLPPNIMLFVMQHALGKPVERVEWKDTSDDIDDMDAEQLEEEAMRLLSIARQLRQDDPNQKSIDKNARLH